MGIFDSITGAFGGKAGGAQENQGLMDAIGGLLGGSGGAGLQGLVDSFTKNGLGDTIKSWIGTGENQPVSADQVKTALGNEQIQQIAGKLGVSNEEASNGLASMLPKIIDKLTPDGKMPDVSSLQGGLGGLMKKLGM